MAELIALPRRPGHQLEPELREPLRAAADRLMRRWPSGLLEAGADGFRIVWRHGHRKTPVRSVIVSFGQHAPWSDPSRRNWWLHASIAHPSHLPSWEELTALHEDCYPGRYAYQVFVPDGAPHEGWVNHHPYALHLWGLWDPDGAGEVLPAFGRHGTI